MASYHPIYLYGDMTVQPWISIDNPVYANKKNAHVLLNSGSVDYKQTAQYQMHGDCTSCASV